VAAVSARRAAPDASLRQSYREAWRTVAATCAVGAGLGLLVGGIGGRLAMRALFLTSDPGIQGIRSDDGFPIGRFDVLATLNLLAVGTVLGVLGVFVYLAVRPFLLEPPWLRYAGCAVAAGLVVGSLLVSPSGVDFTRLGPRWFAIGLFLAIPALFAALAGPAVERAIRPEGWFQSTRSRWALLPLAVFLLPQMFVLLGIPVVVVIGARYFIGRSPRAWAVLRSQGVMWPARVVLVGVGLLSGQALLTDIRMLL
jgi:hypothetical protein